MKLTPEEAAQLNKILYLLYEVANCLEDLRPAGGFKECISKEFCKECGKNREFKEGR